MNGETKYPLHPDITVSLDGVSGNAFALIGTVQRALKRGGVPAAEVDRFRTEAMSGDYDNVLSTIFRWVEVDC